MTPFFTPVTMMISFNEDNAVVKSASHGGGFLRFTPVMEFSITTTLLLLFLLHPAFPKLIVHPDKEAQLSAELILKEADLVKSFQQPGPCHEVHEEVERPRICQSQPK